MKFGKAMTTTQCSDRAERVRRRRHKNPVRESRRQHHLTCCQRRVVDHVPTYAAVANGFVYLKHVAIMRTGEQVNA
jgi:hypothetical protein